MTQVHDWSELEERISKLSAVANDQDRVILYRGQEREDWAIASTFCRSLWAEGGLFQSNPEIADGPDGYKWGLLALTTKFFKQIKPSKEIWAAVAKHPALDPYFEVMRHCQHYPETDTVEPLGTNIIDCSTNWHIGSFFAAGGYEDIVHPQVNGALWLLDATAMGNVLVKDRLLMKVFEDAAEKDGTEAVLPYIHCPNQQRFT